MEPRSMMLRCCWGRSIISWQSHFLRRCLRTLSRSRRSTATWQQRRTGSATGKKVSSVLDGAALFFRAKTLTEKAEALDPVNANISAAMSNVKVANKGLDTMYDNLNGLLTTLKDARSKPITPVTALTTVPSNTRRPNRRRRRCRSAYHICGRNRPGRSSPPPAGVWPTRRIPRSSRPAMRSPSPSPLPRA